MVAALAQWSVPPQPFLTCGTRPPSPSWKSSHCPRVVLAPARALRTKSSSLAVPWNKPKVGFIGTYYLVLVPFFQMRKPTAQGGGSSSCATTVVSVVWPQLEELRIEIFHTEEFSAIVVVTPSRSAPSEANPGVKQAVPYRTGREAWYLSVSTE